MEWERYEQFLVSGDALEFTFDSIGPRGVVPEKDGYFMEPFGRGKEYYGFVVKRKKS